MKKRTAGSLILLGLFLFVSVMLTGNANADLYWENENISKGVPHQLNGTTLQKNYFMANASRIEMGDGKVMLFDYEGLKMYTLHPQARTYTVTNMSEVGMPSGMSAADREMMGKLMGGMMGIKVTPTNEKKTVAGYPCRKYLVNIAVVQGEYWVSQEVKGFRELKAIGARVGSLLENHPVMRQMNVAGLVDKLDGFPVQTTNHIMGGTVVSTLKRVEQKPLDPQLFKVPKGYALKGN
ncbi:MAG: DUF4412 domain-containing protein [Desulfobacteraceae bacterium]|nr:DUF4412 domain-containing protein [Desulfobacteraceae bacterium]